MILPEVPNRFSGAEDGVQVHAVPASRRIVRAAATTTTVILRGLASTLSGIRRQACTLRVHHVTVYRRSSRSTSAVAAH